MAGAALLPPGPEADAGRAVAQPGGALGLQLPGRVLRGIQLVQNIRQQVKILHLFRGALAQVVVKIQVGAARRGVGQQGRPGQHFFLAGGAPRPAAQVGHSQRVGYHQLAVGAGGGSLLFVLPGQGRHLHHFYRLGSEQLRQQPVEPVAGELLPQGSKQLVGVEQQRRVPGVQPAGGGIDGVQHAVRDGAGPLQRGKFHSVQAGQQQLLRDALLRQLLHRPADGGGKLSRALLGGAPQHQLQRGLQGAVVKTKIDVRAQLFRQQRRLQGRLVGAQQSVQQNLHAQLPLPVCKGPGVPGQRTLHFMGLRLFGVIGQLHPHALLRVLHRQAGAAGALGHLGEIFFIQKLQRIAHIQVSVQGDAAVVRAVVAAVHPLVFLVGQRRDGGRVAAGHKAVGRIREQCPAQRVLQLGIRGSQRPLHLVVHHAAHGAVGVPVPALLLKHGLVHHGQRAEHRVQVHVHQVFEIRLVGGGKGVHRLVREGHGVEEGRHAALQQLQKRRFHRVLLAARQHRVLQNMEHARVVGGESAEPDAKGLVVVVVLHQQHRCPADIVGQHGQHAVLLRAVFGLHKGITRILLHRRFSFVFGIILMLLYHASP